MKILLEITKIQVMIEMILLIRTKLLIIMKIKTTNSYETTINVEIKSLIRTKLLLLNKNKTTNLYETTTTTTINESDTLIRPKDLLLNEH